MSKADTTARGTDTEAELFRRCRNAGRRISGDGRIGEADLAWLIGQHPKTVRNMRRTGGGPPWFRIGGAGHKVSYRLSDIAAWLDRHREI